MEGKEVRMKTDTYLVIRFELLREFGIAIYPNKPRIKEPTALCGVNLKKAQSEIDRRLRELKKDYNEDWDYKAQEEDLILELILNYFKDYGLEPLQIDKMQKSRHQYAIFSLRIIFRKKKELLSWLKSLIR